MKSYRDFKSVEELKEFYHINENKNDVKDDQNIKQKIFYNDILDVQYADLDKIDNIFDHIIVFTNDRNTEKNKTLKNIYDAVEILKSKKLKAPEIHVFVAADIQAKEDESEIIITDDEETFTIKDENNTNTLIFSRLGVQDENGCGHVVRLLQDRGFLVLNPVQPSAIACNKYETAVLLQKANIPQPNFTLMTKDILYDEESYIEHMKTIYKEWSKDDSKNKDLEVVIKILNGHGGTGVFLTNGKHIKAILQTIFTISRNTELIIQRKEEADGGDIRVHVLTLRNKQIILAAMKRVKIGGDFRSNVSLGATAEPVKLTKEQEQIALKAARVSKLPWCAVDIMPLIKGSNKNLGNNAVLEINASPGTDGISEVIKTNFINVLLSNLTKPSEFQIQDKVAGYIESVEINWGKNSKKYLGLLDTGNGAVASHIEVGDFEEKDNKLIFTIDNFKYTFDIIERSFIKSREKNERERPVILIPSLRVGLRQANNVKIAIVKSRDKKTNVLLNRDIIGCLGYVIHPTSKHVLTEEMEKIKII